MYPPRWFAALLEEDIDPAFDNGHPGEVHDKYTSFASRSVLMSTASATELPVVPKEYAGRWIAWNQGRTAIVASGMTLREAADAARMAGEGKPGYEWVPPA